MLQVETGQAGATFSMELWEGKVIFNMDSTYFPEIMSSHGGGGCRGGYIGDSSFYVIVFWYSKLLFIYITLTYTLSYKLTEVTTEWIEWVVPFPSPGRGGGGDIWCTLNLL